MYRLKKIFGKLFPGEKRPLSAREAQHEPGVETELPSKANSSDGDLHDGDPQTGGLDTGTDKSSDANSSDHSSNHGDRPEREELIEALSKIDPLAKDVAKPRTVKIIDDPFNELGESLKFVQYVKVKDDPHH